MIIPYFSRGHSYCTKRNKINSKLMSHSTLTNSLTISHLNKSTTITATKQKISPAHLHPPSGPSMEYRRDPPTLTRLSDSCLHRVDSQSLYLRYSSQESTKSVTQRSIAAILAQATLARLKLWCLQTGISINVETSSFQELDSICERFGGGLRTTWFFQKILADRHLVYTFEVEYFILIILISPRI